MVYIDDKYFKLLHLCIYDKRRKTSGMISKISITPSINNIMISYEAYYSKIYSSLPVFVEDFENGSIVFLLPFGTNYMVKELEAMAEKDINKIKEFFGDKYRDDMIMRISEEERQKEIKRWGNIEIKLENWEWFLDA